MDLDTAHVAYAATCRHCASAITTLHRPDVVWVDGEGFPFCRKELPHEPMPAGLAGGPTRTEREQPLGTPWSDPAPWTGAGGEAR